MEIKKDQLQTFKAWEAYMAIRLHFLDEYDYFKYNGTSTWGNIESMEKYFSKYEARSLSAAQRTIFWNLGQAFKDRKDLIFFFLSQFTNGRTYPSVFESDLYEEYKERMNNFHFHLKRDCEEIINYMKEYGKTFDELFVVKNINHPAILKLGLSRTISVETFTTLDILLNFIPQMEKRLVDPASIDFFKLIRSYKPFLSIGVNKEREIIRDMIYEN